MPDHSESNAAQYVRMSTEHQQYSPDNQKQAIATYAAANHLAVVATYEDAGKSGLTLAGRPGLRRLLSDVAAGRNNFSTILVYDISRWGRFQDADESAHLEYLCRLAGVRVEYCAEPFTNDGTPFASICKVVKRALAAEYSRELSVKVYSGKRRLIELGFRQGGSAGFGLRRCLIAQDGTSKGQLARGECKSIATDRVILVPGPASEIAIVKGVFRDYVVKGLGMIAIAEKLNKQGVASESGRPWSKAMVKQILTSEKYLGNNVWGRCSFKLSLTRTRNAPQDWARRDAAFEPIIDVSMWQKAQAIRLARTSEITNDEIVACLKRIYRRRGVITTQLINEDGFVSESTIRKRFGSVVHAYTLAGYQGDRSYSFLGREIAAHKVRLAVTEELFEVLRSEGFSIERVRSSRRFMIDGEQTVAVIVTKERLGKAGADHWRLISSTADANIVVLIEAASGTSIGPFLLPPSALTRDLTLRRTTLWQLDMYKCDNLAAVADLLRRNRL